MGIFYGQQTPEIFDHGNSCNLYFHGSRRSFDFSGEGGETSDRGSQVMQKYGLYGIWVVSCLASFGSFYLGEPSPLDWGQRICLFPFVFIAGIGAWRGFLGIASYLLPQTFLGLCLAFFQFFLIKRPELGLSFLSEPRQDPWISLFSAALFFSLFVFLLILSKRHTQRMFL